MPSLQLGGSASKRVTSVPSKKSPPSSVFDLPSQHGSVDAKIVAAIERLGQAMRVMLIRAGQDSAEGLSPIQAQSLVFLLHHTPELARVRDLAREFSLTPATVSDAVSALVRKGLVTKQRSAEDGRQFALLLTAEGRAVAERMSRWANPVVDTLETATDDTKKATLGLLFEMIAQLQDDGVVQANRMCLTCRHFERDADAGAPQPHQCRLLERALGPTTLRLDCPEHAPVR